MSTLKVAAIKDLTGAVGFTFSSGSVAANQTLIVNDRSDKYITRTYTGDGVTLTFGVTTYASPYQHADDSVLVFLNGVAQIAGTNYTMDANGSNVVFTDAPQSTDTVHILELPI